MTILKRAVPLALIPIVIAVARAAPSPPPVPAEYEYVVVKGVLALDKRPWQDKGNLRPWEEPQRNNPDGTTTITMSNSCGFVEITYEGMSLERYVGSKRFDPVPQNVVESMGEWCTVADLLREHETLLRLRNWRGQRFVERAASIYHDASDAAFIADARFAEEAGIAGAMRRLERVSERKGCFPKNARAAIRTELGDSATLSETADAVCFTSGVFLSDILARTR